MEGPATGGMTSAASGDSIHGYDIIAPTEFFTNFTRRTRKEEDDNVGGGGEQKRGG